MSESNYRAYPAENIVLVGYSGHAYVIADIINKLGHNLIGYIEQSPKAKNPFELTYLCSENDTGLLKSLHNNKFIVGIGDNTLREKIYKKVLSGASLQETNIIHPGANLAQKIILDKGICIMAGAIINPLAAIGKGVIINSGAIVEHECTIGDFVHIAPGAVLAGNVQVGEKSFIGANSVVKQNISIGKNVVIGAGSVIVKDIPDGAVVYGNPGKIKRQNA